MMSNESHENMSSIQLVIFDCDGVLIDSEVISARMLKRAAKRYGADIPMDYIMANYIGRSYPKVLADIQTQFSITLPAHFEEEYRTELLRAFDEELSIMPRLWDVLDGLNVDAAVATSSSPKRVEKSLAKVGLLEFFDGRIFTSSLVQNGKPAPDLFLYTAKSLGVAPENCLVIEDSLSGVQAGLSAGMQIARFVGGQHLLGETDSAGAHWIFDDFAAFFARYPQLKTQT